MKARILRLAALFGILAAVPASAEVVRTLRVELNPAEASHFAVENLVGRMKVSAGQGDGAAIVATIHAEDESLAAGVSLARSAGPGEEAVVHVKYPLADTSRLRYPRLSGDGDSFWRHFDFATSRVEYDGRSVRISDHSGPLLYVDLDVRVPARRIQARFEQTAGRVEAEGVNGSLAFEIRSADADFRRLDGDVAVHGTSGDVRASELRGRWSSTLGSGDCSLEGFEGESAEFRAGSGDIVVRRIRADRLSRKTGSGDARISGADLVELDSSAGSGDLSFRADGDRLKEIRATSGSGDIALELPADASFDASTEHGSGDVIVRFKDALARLSGDKVVGMRRGENGVRIDTRTGSGDLVIAPNPAAAR
jgi:hypothetical protein